MKLVYPACFYEEENKKYWICIKPVLKYEQC